MKNFFLAIAFCVSILFIACNEQKADENLNDDNYVIMLSMDGFRWDYTDHVDTPWFDYIAENGVKAEYSKPVFPSKTFVNHYSIATGLYPDKHGIVNNNFYCPENGAYGGANNRGSIENGDFYFGEPIWVTAEKQNIKTASYFWVGSEAPVQGIYPSIWKKYDGGTPYQNRVDSVFAWLDLPDEIRPRLITFYFEQPDGIGHRGPESQAVDSVIVKLDSILGDFITRLQKLDIYDKINLIVTSDHGMSSVSSERYIDLGDYVNEDIFERIQGGNPIYMFTPKDTASTDSILTILRKIEHISVWKKDSIPAELKYGKSPRIESIIVVADSSWSIGWGIPNPDYANGGAHGYDTENKDMHTIFYGMGPAFKSNHKHNAIEVVDIYGLVAKILNLEPATNDGDFERIKGMLKE